MIFKGDKTKGRKGLKIQIHESRGLYMLFFCLLTLFFAASSFAGNFQDASEDTDICITVSGEAQVTGERILLGQVAKVSGANRELREKIMAVDLGTAPRPGRERRVPGRLVVSRLDSCEWLPAATRTMAPDWIIVKGAFQMISNASLEALFKTYIDRHTDGDETVVSRVKIRGLKQLPPGSIELTPLGRGGDYMKGRVSLRLAVVVAGEDQGQVSISGWVDRYAQVACATRYIDRGGVISTGDVNLKRINVSKAPDRIIFDLNQVLGKQLRSRVQAGEYLKTQMLKDPPLIERGDRVKIVARSDRLRVSTMGIAKADGARGEQIRVENAVSEKTVVGRVLDRGIVEVLF
jgi:flagella basal body P-ring formation protein FlgA